MQAYLTSRRSTWDAGGKDNSFGSGALSLPTPPRVTSFSPSAAPVGTTVTINGNLSDAEHGELQRRHGPPGELTATSVNAVVPAGAATGPLSVTTAEGPGPQSDFKVSPKVTGFSPDHGTRRRPSRSSAARFTGATQVTFNGVTAAGFGVAATTRSTRSSRPTATTGKVAVTTPAGTATSTASFTVVLKPSISSFTPSSARPGSTSR